MTELAPDRVLADALVRRWRTAADSDDPAGPAGPRPGAAALPEQLSFAQEGIWAAERLRAGEQVGIVFAGVSAAPLDRAALAAAVERIGLRHPVLLTGVQEGLGVARQVLTGQSEGNKRVLYLFV